eukprot:5637080-Pyramimonas_sp.AAC.1
MGLVRGKCSTSQRRADNAERTRPRLRPRWTCMNLLTVLPRRKSRTRHQPQTTIGRGIRRHAPKTVGVDPPSRPEY